MMEDNGAHFFEGTEKLLEVWFSRQDEAKGTGDLRTIPRFESVLCVLVSPVHVAEPPPHVWLHASRLVLKLESKATKC